jgi:hypothetical protein
MNNSHQIIREKTKISPEVRELIKNAEERYTIVHCRYFTQMPTYARIWPTTYLFENDGSFKQLLHAIDIAVSPEWKLFGIFSGYIEFTLIFEGLSKSCTSFHLEEIIPEPRPFMTSEIQRNQTDVYNVELFIA